MTHLVIVGGSDAGTEAALRARQADPELGITILVADEYLNYSICGLPFFISGEVERLQALAHRAVDEVTGRGIEVLLGHRALRIDIERQVVDVERERRQITIPYDRLIVATGARPLLPSLAGVDAKDVHVLHTMADGIALRERLDRQPPDDAVVIGSGYIGVEMADALTRRGVHVTLVGRATSVLRTIDPSLGALVASELERNGVTVMTDAAVERIDRRAGRLRVAITGGRRSDADLVVIGAGVRPNADLAVSAGLATGPTGAIQVTQRMETNAPAVWAAGDCVETWHAVLEAPTYLPLGTTAHKQGRVAGENAAGRESWYRGSVGTQVVKVFDLAAARTGLSETDAEAGFSPVTVASVVPDHKPYYPDARDLHIRVTGDATSGRLLGAQIVGDWRAEVAKRIDLAAIAIQEGVTVAQLSELDLSYTPPVSAPWDPIQVAADAWDGSARLRPQHRHQP